MNNQIFEKNKRVLRPSTPGIWDELYTSAFLPLNKKVSEMKEKIDALFSINPELLRVFYPHLSAYLDNCAEESLGSLVEVGCGTGIYSYVISKFVNPSYKLYLLDHSEKALEMARKLFDNRKNTFFIQADIFQKPPLEGKYDAVITGGLIEHFVPDVQYNLVSYLKTLAKVQIHQYPVSNFTYWSQRFIISAFNGLKWPFGYEVPLNRQQVKVLFPEVKSFYRTGLVDRILFRTLSPLHISEIYKYSKCNYKRSPFLYFDEVLVTNENKF